MCLGYAGCRTDGIIFAEGEFKSVGFIEVERVRVVQDADIHLPFF